jgi:hypothetical protein
MVKGDFFCVKDINNNKKRIIMNNDYWKKYLEQRKRAEELHDAEEEVVEEVVEEVHEEVAEEVEEVLLEEPPVDDATPVEGQVKNNGLTIFRNGRWQKRFPNN